MQKRRAIFFFKIFFSHFFFLSIFLKKRKGRIEGEKKDGEKGEKLKKKSNLFFSFFFLFFVLFPLFFLGGIIWFLFKFFFLFKEKKKEIAKYWIPRVSITKLRFPYCSSLRIVGKKKLWCIKNKKSRNLSLKPLITLKN